MAIIIHLCLPVLSKKQGILFHFILHMVYTENGIHRKWNQKKSYGKNYLEILAYSGSIKSSWSVHIVKKNKRNF